ncbi:MAG TPA: hypothetical protein VJA21_01815 [Verrucomicrobiae bacterium]
MNLAIPEYLRKSNVQQSSVHYQWDDWDDLPALEAPDKEVIARLAMVSQRAALAFACGSAEWIVWRFARLCDVSAPWDFVAGAWAMIIDVRYCGYGTGTGWQEYSLGDWEGPVKGPIKDGLELLETAFQQLAWEGHTDPTRYAGLIAVLTSYVMTDDLHYKKWSGQVLQRFESLYPRNPEDLLGDVVPRQAVDTELDFHVDQSEALINQFLASLDYRTNAFLSSPEGMLEHFDGEDDFRGSPYVFDAQKDRQSRRER